MTRDLSCPRGNVGQTGWPHAWAALGLESPFPSISHKSVFPNLKI